MTLDNIKKLCQRATIDGFETACSYCGKIKNNGRWELKLVGPKKMISSGICPVCEKIHFPE